MMKRYMFVLVSVLLFAGAADAQYPLLDMIAQKVIQKYQQSTCEQFSRKTSRNRRWNRKSSRNCAVIHR